MFRGVVAIVLPPVCGPSVRLDFLFSARLVTGGGAIGVGDEGSGAGVVRTQPSSLVYKFNNVVQRSLASRISRSAVGRCLRHAKLAAHVVQVLVQFRCCFTARGGNVLCYSPPKMYSVRCAWCDCLW